LRHLTSLLWETAVQTMHRFFPRRFVKKPGPHSATLLQAALANERLCQIYYIDNAAIQSMNCAVTAVNLAEAGGPSPELARAYGNTIVTTAVISAFALSDMYERLAQKMGTAVGHVASLAYARETAGLYLAGAGRRDQAELRLAESIDLAESIGDRRRWDEAKFLSAILSQAHGRLAEARTRFTDLYVLGCRQDIVQVQLWGLTGRVSLSMAMGGDAEAFDLLDKLLTEYGDQSGAIARADAILAYGTIAQAHFRAGDVRKARLTAERVVRHIEQSASISYYLLPGYHGLAETLTGLFAMREGDGKAERKMVHTMLTAFGPFAMMYPAARPMNYLWRGVFARLDGQTGRARRLFTKSANYAERLGMPYAVAQANRELAYLVQTQTQDLTARVAQVREMFNRCGAARDAEGLDERPFQSNRTYM
jgi:tetratricopeptide (TPR) repeat protein